MDENLLVKKLKVFITENYGGNIQAFSKAIGQPPTTVRACINRNRKINVNILISIKELYPDFDMNEFFSEKDPYASSLLLKESGDVYNSKQSSRSEPSSDGIDKLIAFLKNNQLTVQLKSDN